MGCSPSHALIINSGTRQVHDALCLQPRIYMVSESTLRILQDVGELRIYQHEDKDPGIARVRFGTATIDQLENPVRYQTQIRRQSSLTASETEQAGTSRRESKMAEGLEIAEENEEEIENDSEENRENSCTVNGSGDEEPSPATVIFAQIHSQNTTPTVSDLITNVEGELSVASLKEFDNTAKDSFGQRQFSAETSSISSQILSEGDTAETQADVLEEFNIECLSEQNLENAKVFFEKGLTNESNEEQARTIILISSPLPTGSQQRCENENAEKSEGQNKIATATEQLTQGEEIKQGEI